MTTTTTTQRICEKHGAYEPEVINGIPFSRCMTCIDEQREKRIAEREAQRAAEKAERDARALQERIDRSGVPPRFIDRSFDNFAVTNDGQRAALAFARAYAERFGDVLESGRSAIFCGRPGAGKTHLAVAIAMHVIHGGHKVVLTTAYRAVGRIKATWRPSAMETEREAVLGLVRPDLLILDEVGVQFGSEAERIILFDVLNRRYEHRLPVLLLSNLSADGVRDALGERIIDRLREDNGQIVVFDWQSHRGAA